MEKFRRYYETLLANYHAIGQQLQHSELYTAEVKAQLQEKRKEIETNIQIFLAKCSSLRSNATAQSSGMTMNAEIKASIPAISETITPNPPFGTEKNSLHRQSENLMINRPEITKKGNTLDNLLNSIDPNASLDRAGRTFLLGVADRFISNVATFSSMLAKSRNATSLSEKDIRLCLEQCHSIKEPNKHKGVGKSNTRSGTEAHKLRLQQVKKAAAMSNTKSQNQ